MKPTIGFIGQGYIGSSYATDFEDRGFKVVRYSVDAQYIGNKDAISGCDVVFIAVPTPTTPKGFDDSIVRGVVSLVGKGKIAVIKSTVIPGTTESIQKQYPDIFVFHSPEFLRSATAKKDAANPERNIIGIPIVNPEYDNRAKMVLSILPKAPFTLICPSREAELVKYIGNCFLYTKVVYMNIIYDLVTKLGVRFDVVADAVAHDFRIGKSHMNPVDGVGRGAGGHCFIKDFEAFVGLCQMNLNDEKSLEVLTALRDKNVALLRESGKSLDFLDGIYKK